nr:hypothetical protein [Streptomyces sp. Alain-F2R5]
MSHTSSTVPPPPASSESFDDEQAASEALSTSAESRASERYFTVHLWEGWRDELGGTTYPRLTSRGTSG